MQPLFKIFVISIFMLTSNIDVGATKASASKGNLNLVVELNDPQDKATVDRKLITFKSALRNYPDYLSNGPGLWGTGPFNEFFCVKSRKDIIRDNSKSEKNKWTWKLRVSIVDKTRIFEILYRDTNGIISVATT